MSSQETHRNLFGSIGVRFKNRTSRVLIGILHDPTSYDSVVPLRTLPDPEQGQGGFFTLQNAMSPLRVLSGSKQGESGVETRREWTFVLRKFRNGSVSATGTPYTGSLRKVAGSRHHVHSVYVSYEVGRTSQRTRNSLTEYYLRSEENRERRIEIYSLSKVY